MWFGININTYPYIFDERCITRMPLCLHCHGMYKTQSQMWQSIKNKKCFRHYMEKKRCCVELVCTHPLHHQFRFLAISCSLQKCNCRWTGRLWSWKPSQPFDVSPRHATDDILHILCFVCITSGTQPRMPKKNKNKKCNYTLDGLCLSRKLDSRPYLKCLCIFRVCFGPLLL